MKKLVTILLAVITLNSYGKIKNGPKHESLKKAKGLVENIGQITDDKGLIRNDIICFTESEGVKVYISNNGIHYMFSKSDSLNNLELVENGNEDHNKQVNTSINTYRLDVELVNANPNPKVFKGKADGYFENYYLAHCPEGLIGAKSYEEYTLKDVYPGIDWVIYKNGDFVKYDFLVHPGIDPNQIKIKIKGAKKSIIDNEGSIIMVTPLGEIKESAPLTFAGENQELIRSEFVLKDDFITFNIDNYDSTNILRIDPSLVWSTYYGGTQNDVGRDCISDINGNVYIIGDTRSTNAISSGGHQNTYGGGNYDSYIVKFNSNGVRLWATYYGGSNSDYGWSGSADVNGNVYIVGYTPSTSSIANGGHQNTYGGGTYDAFIVKLNNSGVRQWASYYGGTDDDRGMGCSTDLNGNVYLAGYTRSTSSIASGGHQNTHGAGTIDAFLVKFNGQGVRQWATYYGGAGVDYGYNCETDANGNIFLCGSTGSSTGISSNGHQMAFAGGLDGFLVKFNDQGVRQWGTYYGGTSLDDGFGCTTDANGNAYLSGQTQSTTGIGFQGYRNVIGGGADGFIAKFNSSGTRQWGTYYGGSLIERGEGCAVDAVGNVYLSGYTASTSGIAFGAVHQNTFGGGNRDAFLVMFNSSCVRQWATYFGKTGDDRSFGCCVAPTGDVYITGWTNSTFGISNNGHQNNLGGNYDAYLTKFLGSACQAITSTDTRLSCDSLLWIDGNTYYTNNTTATHTITNGASNGCDSIVTLNLTINQTAIATDTRVACDSLLWIDGNTYYANNTSAQHTIVGGAANNCDSIVTLNLTVNQTAVATDTRVACDSLLWIDGITYYTNNTTAQHTIVGGAANNCDSIVTLNLTVNQTATSTDTRVACDSLLWIDGNTYYANNTTAQHTIVGGAANNCDSIVTLNLTINTVDTSVTQNVLTFTANATGATFQWIDCDNNNAAINGETNASYTATANGNYAVVVTQNGCTDTSACFNVSGVGIRENSVSNATTVYPNPSSTNFTIETADYMGKTIVLFNAVGQQIYSKVIRESKTVIEVSEIGSKGVYILNIIDRSAEVISTNKLIVE